MSSTNPFTDLLTVAIHGDSDARLPTDRDIAPPLHNTTITKYPSADKLYRLGEVPADHTDISSYSRCGHYNADRVEAVLSKLLDGHAVAYSGGLSAFHALLHSFSPKQLFIGQAYAGVHGVAQIASRSGLQIFSLDAVSEKAQKGDIVHIESPVNPKSNAIDIAHYASLAHEKGATVVVDATFAPPPLLHPFKHGADVIMHSASKYLSGHSDVIAGVLVVKKAETASSLREDREYLGTILAPLETLLLLRSLKTYPLRLQQQSHNANTIIKFLDENRTKFPKLTKINAAMLQQDAFIKDQLPLGGSPTFSIEVTDVETAKQLPDKLKLFYHATSLGSVHSLIEWRALCDKDVDPKLLRISVGIEKVEDLIADLEQALK